MKKQIKKMTLNSETLRTLDPESIQDALAGSPPTTTRHVGCTATNLCSGCKPCF